MYFEWDEEKARLNFIKHGIRFQTAAKVFLDPDYLIRSDYEHGEEGRYNIIGKVGRVLFVVFIFRERDRIRLISARRATPNEIERYENGKDWVE